MSDKTLEMAMLFDFYGELLTEKQRTCFDLYYNNDLSLSEIAENMGISRQGVRDSLVRAEQSLTETEEKTGLVRRFQQQRQGLDRARELARTIGSLSSPRAQAACEELVAVLMQLES